MPDVMTLAEQMLAYLAAAQREAEQHRGLQSMAGLLWNADPDCDHEIVDGNFYSGIKCAKCPGWHCA